MCFVQYIKYVNLYILIYLMWTYDIIVIFLKIYVIKLLFFVIPDSVLRNIIIIIIISFSEDHRQHRVFGPLSSIHHDHAEKGCRRTGKGHHTEKFIGPTAS